MTVTYLKRATKTPTTGEDEARAVVETMLRDIESGREVAARDYAKRFDRWDGEIIVSRETIAQSGKYLSETLKEDIRFAHERIRAFAQHQRDSLSEFEVDLLPGLRAGQRLIPVLTAGCYVPGGRYAHVASAVMSVTTAKVAGVRNVIACSPPRGSEGVHPAILYTLDLCGADTVLALGGVQGVAALAFGLFTGHAADIIVGPGNRYVAEAKRILFGRVGIDLFAGPTEICIIADDSADPEIVATDLVGQAEHGPDSPAWLVTTSRRVAEAAMKRVPEIAATLPEPNRTAASSAWRDYGEVVLVDTREEAVKASDGYAAEHLEVHARDLDWWLKSLSNYGSLFLGEETTVAYGDKASGPNHILPTKGAARYTGGLSVGKFIKTVTYQRMSRDANAGVGVASARISRLEGMEGHARTADCRLAKYFPDRQFDLAG
jgi:sulfopropanediol 3-dehydrogenase